MFSGSTPGLINTTLGEIPGNRIPLPDLKMRERRRKETSSEDTDNDSTSPLMHRAQAPPHVQASRAPRIDQSRTPQTPHRHWKRQSQQPLQGSSSNVATAPFPMASTNSDSPAASFTRVSTASVFQHPIRDLRRCLLSWRCRKIMALKLT